jgi:hypothetical protein
MSHEQALTVEKLDTTPALPSVLFGKWLRPTGLLIATFALALTSCSQKNHDFEVAKSAVAQELVSADTTRFCPISEAMFSTKNGARSVKQWVETQNKLGRQVRTHFEVTIDPKSGSITGATCLECAAEDENQKLPEAMTELQKLTSPPK